MPTPQQIEQALKKVRDQSTFVQELLVGALGWEIPDGIQKVEDISFGWTTAELRAEGLEKHLITGGTWQIQPLRTNQPWGIFLLEFQSADAFTSGRGMTGPLRKVLRGLVPSRRRDSNLAAWKRENLLFICTHNYEHYRVAYFKAPSDATRTAPLTAFGWGPDIPSRTACEFNLPDLAWPDDGISADDWIAQWAAAFDVEKVTKRFYEDYARTFGLVEKLIAKHAGLGTGDELRMFTQTLLNRLMFLRFIERKGWLIFDERKDYLRALHEAGPIGRRSFYQTRLRPLFFEGLAVDGKRKPEAVGNVPFLNGGLFEEGALDKKAKDIPDEAFAPIIGPDGLFYRYNFTVEESTPLDIEVAVDPEMLGKVFEELVTGRHESGSYYTPRPVVAFMCREALKGYLTDKLVSSVASGKGRKVEKAERPVLTDAIATLVDKREVKGLTESHGKQILEALDSLKAVDPACGSGAYLLGLLQEMIALYRLLQSEKLVRDARSLYELKLRIISHNLYGVDIDRFATNIAMLRLWLSLSVEADQPLPLPNLEFKIETGDSLLGPCDWVADTLEADALRIRANSLVRLKERYLVAHGEEKRNTRAAIEQEERGIAYKLHSLRGQGIVDWRVQLAEVFLTNKGFDIVLANPPYIRQELIKDLKPALKKVYGAEFSGTADLYVFFYLRALQLLAGGGMLAFISSNKWFRAGYGQKLRSLVARQTSVQTILDFHDLPVFESAIAYPMIFVAAKKPPAASHTPTLAEPPSLDPPFPDVTAVVAKFGQPLPTTALGTDGTWHLTSSTVVSRLEKMRAAGPTLDEFVGGQIYNGVKTGLNRAFVLDNAQREELLKQDPGANEYILPYLEGDDIKRWATRTGAKWIIYLRWTDDLKEEGAIAIHLKRHEAQLRSRDGVKDDGPCPWFSLSRPRPEAFAFITNDKIVFPDIAPNPRFTLDTSHAVIANTGYIIPSADLFLLGVLNSMPVEIYYINASAQVRGGYLRFIRQYVEKLPIPNASAAERKAIAGLTKRCLAAEGVGCEAWEREIDERVAALYGIDLADIERTSRRTPIYETKTYLEVRTIPKVSKATAGFPYFSLTAIRKDLEGHRGDVEPESLNRYLHELTKEGVIFDAGRGWYSTLREPFVLDREPVRGLVELLEKRFPLLDFSCWSTVQIAGYSHHQLARFVSFVYVEQDAMESVADALREAGLTAYLNPSQAEVEKSVRLADGTVIVRPAVTRAPVDGHYATIEKILVDLYVEADALRLIDAQEYRKTALNAVSAGRIKLSGLITYAEDRRSLRVEAIFGAPIN